MTHLNGIPRLSVLIGNLVIASVLGVSSPSSAERAVIDIPAVIPQKVANAPQWLVEEDRPQQPEVQATSVKQTPSKKQVPRDKTKRCPEFEKAFRQYGLTPVETFSYIAWRESRCRIKAINARFNSRGEVTWTLNRDGSIDRGILQVNSSWKSVTSQVCKTPYGDMDVLLTLDCNLKVGKYLLENGGLRHWSM